MASPVIDVWCDVPPVVMNGAMVEKVAVVEVLYAQSAFSSVVSVSDAWVVPAGSVPVGAMFVITGGVVLAGWLVAVVVTVTVWLVEPPTPLQVSV